MRRVTVLEVLIFVIMIVLVLATMSRGAFADEQVAIRTLETQGYSNLQITEHVWFAVGFRGCDKNDAARFTARATNPAGKQVEVCVCTGLFFKGGTIRVR